MKRLTFLMLAIIASITFYSCTKTEADITPSTLANADLRDASLIDQISVVNGMLQFPSLDHAKSTVEYLEGVFEEASDIDSAATEFEANFPDFYSLRLKVFEDMEVWLNNEELDYENHPDEHYWTDPSIKAIVNEFGDFMVNGSIMSTDDDGITYEILDASPETLAMVHQGLIDPFNPPDNVLIHGELDEEKSPPCKRNKSTSWYAFNTSYNNKSLKVEGKVRVTNNIFNHKLKGYVRIYKWKNSRWKKEKKTMIGFNAGITDLPSNTCETAELGKAKSKKRHRVSGSSGNGSSFSVGSGEVAITYGIVQTNVQNTIFWVNGKTYTLVMYF